MGDLMNAAEVDSGGIGAAGTLTVTGNYTQTAAGVLNIEIGGYNAGTDFDQLNVQGNVSLGGTLNVTLLNGFVPNDGDAFQVLTYNSRGMPVTNFSTMNLNAGNGITFTPTYDDVDMPGGLTLTANVGMDGAPAPNRHTANHQEEAAALSPRARRMRARCVSVPPSLSRSPKARKTDRLF